MADIKTRDAVKGTIKTIDKAAIASERMKSAYAKIKDKAEQGYYSEESSATEYASDKTSYAADRIKDEGIHQFNKQGQKGVQSTKENIVKAKDRIADFKTKRAMKAAEKKQEQAAAMRGGSAVHHRGGKRTAVPDAKHVFMSFHVDPNGDINRTFYNPAFIAHMVMDGIHENHSINFFQWSFLPSFHNGKDLIRDPADGAVRDFMGFFTLRHSLRHC